MAWKSVMRDHGYDPAIVKDAKFPLEVGIVQRQDLNGSMVGNPCECCGARLVRRQLSAEMAWIGAKFAIVIYSKKKAIRYKHNGGIPSSFDKGFFPLGAPLRLNPPTKHEKLGNGSHGLNGGHRKRDYKHRFASIVGQFRR